MMQREGRDVAEPHGLCIRGPDDFKEWGEQSPVSNSEKPGHLTHLPAQDLKIVAAAPAKLFQSCPTLCDPIGGSPPGSTIPRILQARTLEWVAISFSSKDSRREKKKQETPLEGGVGDFSQAAKR